MPHGENQTVYERPVTTDIKTCWYCPPLGFVLLETKGSYGSSLPTICLQGSRPEVLSSPPAVLESLAGELAHPSLRAFFFFCFKSDSQPLRELCLPVLTSGDHP